MRTKLCECKLGEFVVAQILKDAKWVSRHGLFEGDTISVIKNDRNYVVFYLGNFVCAIDRFSAESIFVEAVKNG